MRPTSAAGAPDPIADREGGAVRLSPAYLRAVERLEELPENRPLSDKTWVEMTLREYAGVRERARRRR